MADVHEAGPANAKVDEGPQSTPSLMHSPTGTLSKLPTTWGRGIVQDFRRTVGTWWVAEMTNPNLRTVAVSFFLYLACVAPAITFGAIYAKLVNNWMGAMEMLVATAWTGIVYALIGGQPLMINGGTGPVLAFTWVLYELSKSMDVPFLSLQAWIGVWVFVYMMIAAFVDLNRILHHATRFTDDIFSGLISAIFIVNALGSPTSTVGVFHYFDNGHPSHDDYRDDDDYSHLATALVSLLLCLGTTYLSLQLRAVKTSPFLPGPRSRAVVGDFAVVASVIVFAVLNRFAFDSLNTETLKAPDSFAPTFQCCSAACKSSWPEECPAEDAPFGTRPWLVDLGDLNGKAWVPFFATVPALLAFILVFLDNGITWHLINRPENKITHGHAYNYDTVVIGVSVLVQSFLGLPWLVAATVRSINHVQALADKDSSGKIVSIQQTRLTHLGIHTLVLITLFAMDVLKQLPLAVLYGVFLYMGIVGLSGNQFWERVKMLLMQPSKYPKQPYTECVKPSTMHKFTAIQLVLFVALYVVKSVKSIAIAFPLIIMACIPIRIWLLPRMFSAEELMFLDGDDSDIAIAMAKKQDEKSTAPPPVDEHPAAKSQPDEVKGLGEQESAKEDGRGASV